MDNNFTNIPTHISMPVEQDEREKALKAEREVYQAEHPKPWYLGGISQS